MTLFFGFSSFVIIIIFCLEVDFILGIGYLSSEEVLDCLIIFRMEFLIFVLLFCFLFEFFFIFFEFFFVFLIDFFSLIFGVFILIFLCFLFFIFLSFFFLRMFIRIIGWISFKFSRSFFFFFNVVFKCSFW